MIIKNSKKKLKPILITSKRTSIAVTKAKMRAGNILKFKNLTDLINFYRSTVFYNKKSEASLTRLFFRHKRKNGYFNIVKSAKLYKFLIN